MSSEITPHPAVSEFLDIVSEVLHGVETPIALHEPYIGRHEREAVLRCLDSTFVSTVGPFTGEFEAGLQQITGAKHVIAMANGTSALHIALVACGVRHDDEVLIPDLTFVATANAVSHAGAVPVLLDVEPSHFGLEAEAVREFLGGCRRHADGSLVNPETGRRVAAIVPMHVFGFPAQIREIVEVAAEFGVAVVEDSAESLGSTLGDRHTGLFGNVGVLSFNGNKIITTGGGGAVITDDDELARRIRHISTTAKVPHKWKFFHDEVGWNYRMPNLNASLGVGQLRTFQARREMKRDLAERYICRFSGSTWFEPVIEAPGTSCNYWLSTVLLKSRDRTVRDAVLDAAVDTGFGCRPAWTLMHRLPMYTQCPRGSVQVSEDLEDRIINLPSSPQIIGAVE